MHLIDNQQYERGSALVYILIAIALLAALTVSFMQPSSQQATSQKAVESFNTIIAQANFIRSAIQECVLIYPAGDDSLAGVSTNTPYPIDPSSTYLTSPDGDDKVANIRCPGNPGSSADHGDIFGGTSGKFMPPAPNLFEDWEYYNGKDGVFFYTRTTKSDAYLQTAMQKLDGKFSECETDIVDASLALKELTDSEGSPDCPSGSTCFRVWVITRSTATYNGDTDTDETSCP